MSRFRFSIASFLIVVTLLAMGLAAMASQSPLATSLAYTAFLVLLGVASAGTLLATGPPRAFWVGFAIFGWTYWFVEFDTTGERAYSTAPSFVVSLSGFSGRSSSQQARPAPGLVTGSLVDWLETAMTTNLSIGAKVMAKWKGGAFYSGTITQAQSGQYLIVWDDGSPQQWTPPSQIAPNSTSLRLAAHATLGGVFALLGGVLVTAVFSRSPSAAPRAASEALPAG
jgi:hypothetical protein